MCPRCGDQCRKRNLKAIGLEALKTLLGLGGDVLTLFPVHVYFKVYDFPHLRVWNRGVPVGEV